MVDIGCSSKRAPLVITTKLAAAILVVAVVRRRGSAGPVLPGPVGKAPEKGKAGKRRIIDKPS